MRESNADLAEQILSKLEAFLDPEILVVPKGELLKLPLAGGGSFTERGQLAVIDVVKQFGKFMRRSVAENDSNYVQIIACGLLAHKDRVFLFERRERDPKYRLYGKATVWQGCHVPVQDGETGMDLLKTALLDRITKSLFLSRSFQLELMGYCWSPDDAKSSHHFGVIFQVDIDNEHTATDLRKKEFRSGRGHGLAGRFIEWGELQENEELGLNLESWSISILSGLKDSRT